MKKILPYLILFIGLLVTFVTNISLGSVEIPLKVVLLNLLGVESETDHWNYIITSYRLPKAITAVLVGSGLGISGLLMQTLFRNPLAGPYVLGLSSGASLGVALLILGAGLFSPLIGGFVYNSWSIVIASSLGSFLVLLLVMLMASKVKDTMSLLIIGLMLASITSSVVSILAYFSPASNLQTYIFWSFGSLGNLSWDELAILFGCIILGSTIALGCLKNMNALLLGDKYATSLGVNIDKNRHLIILATSLLAGSITAFAGPIAFIGLAVPHLVRQLFKTNNHFVLLPSVFLVGGILMLICDSIAQLPGLDHTLPINAITSLFGAPVVIWLLVKKKKMYF